VAVFNKGRIEQVGTPQEVYERPATAFVAGFVGTSNLLSGEAARSLLGGDTGDPGLWTVRPERIALLAPDAEISAGAVVAGGEVREVVYAGATTRVVVVLDAGGELVALARGTTGVPARADRVRLAWRPEDAYRLPGPVPAPVAAPA
jgi:putative spermidine/putrescine transport system ATP-binding protein